MGFADNPWVRSIDLEFVSHDGAKERAVAKPPGAADSVPFREARILLWTGLLDISRHVSPMPLLVQALLVCSAQRRKNSGVE